MHTDYLTEDFYVLNSYLVVHVELHIATACVRLNLWEYFEKTNFSNNQLARLLSGYVIAIALNAVKDVVIASSGGW